MAIYKLVSDRLLQCLRDIVGSIKCSLGEPNGIATLDDTGNVPLDQLANAGGGGGGTPGGANTNIQFNNSGSFGGTGHLTWDDGTNTLNVGNYSSSSNGIITVGGSGTGIGLINGGGGSLQIDGGPLTLNTTGGGITVKTVNTNRLTIDSSGNMALVNSILTIPSSSLLLGGSTSGTTTLNASPTASGVLTLPAATDTLLGKATTDTLTNKSISGLTNTLSNIAESSVINLTTDLAAKASSSASLGTLYNKTTFANTSDFTLVGSPTFTAGSGVISVSAGTQGPSAVVGTTNTAFNQVAKISAYGGTVLEKYLVTYKFNVGITPAGTTYGTGVGTYSVNTGGALSNCIAYFNMSTNTGTGTVSILAGGSNTTVAISPTAIAFSNGDSISLTIERFGDKVFASVRNLTTVSAIVSCTYTFDLSTASGITAPNTSNFSIVNFGGSYSITSINITSKELKAANVMFVGDSKIQGYSTAFDGRIAAQVGRFYPGTIVCAGQSDRTQDVLNHMAEMVALAPKQVVLCVGRNDLAGGVSTGTWQANLSSIVSQLQTAGVTVWLLDAIFETVVGQTTLTTYIRSTFPSNYINTYDPSNTTGALAPDNVHPSFLGATIVANTIIDSKVLVDFGTYINGSSAILRLSPTFLDTYIYGALVQSPGSVYQPAYNANDIVTLAGSAITSAYGSAAQKNRLVVASNLNAAMEFRNYTGGSVTSTPAFSWFGAGTSATGNQVELMRVWEDGVTTHGNLGGGISNRAFSTNPGDIVLPVSGALRGCVLSTVGNEGSMLPFTSSGHTEIRNYYVSGIIRFFTSTGVAGTQGEAMDIFTSGNIGLGFTTDQATGKLQVNGTTTTLGLKPKVIVSSAATLSLNTTGTTWVYTGATPTIWTLPAITGNTDLTYFIKNRGSDVITLTRAGSDNLYTTTSVITLAINPGEFHTIFNDGTFWCVM